MSDETSEREASEKVLELEAPKAKVNARSRTLVLLASLAGAVTMVWLSISLLGHAPAQTRSAHPGIKVRGKTALELAKDAPQWKALALAAAKPAAARWTDPIPGNVTFDARRASRVDSPLSGRVSRTYVELGQRVARGAPLFTVTSTDIANLNADIARAKVDLVTAKANVARVRAMVKARALPAKDEFAAVQRQKAAELALSLARQKRAALKVRGSASNAFTVVSPQAGVVVDKNVLVGQEVSASSSKALVQVADLAQLWVVAYLPEAEATNVAVGARARVSSPSLSAAVEGEVELVSAVVDPKRHTVPIRVRVTNTKSVLRANMFVNVSFWAKALENAVEVPATSVVSDGSEQYLYVKSGASAFKRRRVVTGAMHAGLVPIYSGVKAGEMVVVRGAILLDNHLALAN
ncbi:MAG: efflux RND transporter periplasmic adaptor subunit [Myxococcales bacterium]|nr:efflux RND transporter periplasmic adaptor subunit [Myxococcales bacterium]